MTPLNREEIKKANPQITDDEITEFEELSNKLYSAELMSGELHVDRITDDELDRYNILFHKIFLNVEKYDTNGSDNAT
jgi:hypothetical protein